MRNPWWPVIGVAVTCALVLPEAARSADPRPSSRPRASITGFAVTEELPGTARLELLNPEAIALDHYGNVILADTGNHRVLVVSPDGLLLREIGGFGWDEDSLDTPSDVCVYDGFFVYVVDEGNRRVVSYDAQGDYVGLVVGEDEAGTPVSVAVSPSGGLHIVDLDSQSVISFSQFDEILEPVGRFGLDEGGLLEPTDVAAGPSREIAVADRGRHSVEVFDEFGTRLYSVTMQDTLMPTDVAFDDRGNMLVTDELHGRLLAFARGGGKPTAVLETPKGFWPVAVAVGWNGRSALLDGRSGRVQMIELLYASETPAR